MTDTQEALKVVEAIRTLSSYLDLIDTQVVSRLAFYDEALLEKLKQACDLHNRFLDLGIADRARALGLEVVEE